MPFAGFHNPIEGYTEARLIFDQSGYVQLNSQDLINAGLEVNGIDELLLTYKGQPHPFWLDEFKNNRKFTINFYVPDHPNRYSTQQILLIKTNSKIDSQIDATPIEPLLKNTIKIVPTAITSEIMEQNMLYLPKSEMEDPYLWSEISEISFDIEIPLKGKLISPLHIGIKIWSPSSAHVEKDHGIKININGVEKGIFEWKGSGFHQIQFQVPLNKDQKSLKLNLSSINPQGVIAQRNYLDWIEIQKTQLLQLDDPILNMIGNGTQYHFDELHSSGYIVERDQKQEIDSVWNVEPKKDIELETRNGYYYDWIPKQSMHIDAKILPIEKSRMDYLEIPVDWMVITPNSLQSALDPLIKHRQKQGFRTLVVDPQQLYDLYSGGFPDPDAFRIYFKELDQKFGFPPKYVLLVGDFSNARLDYQSSLNFIPSVWIQSALIGETISDMPLMDINKDLQPDLIIGRIPADDPQNIRNWIDKVIEVEASLIENQGRKIVTISDGQEMYFAHDAKSFADDFQKPFSATMINIDKDQENANILLKQKLNESVFLLAYFGHGSIDSWGKDKIVTISDIDSFTNQMTIPIILNLTCLTGYYIDPNKESLTEALLFSKGMGAAVVLAPTSLTSAVNQAELRKQLAVSIQLPKNKYFGDVLMDTWSKMNSEYEPVLEVMQTFGLFGDPAMILFP